MKKEEQTYKQLLWEFEKVNNPFFPNSMQWHQKDLIAFAEYCNKSQLANESPLLDKEGLSLLFKNKSDCYVDTWENNNGIIEEGDVIPAMTEEAFIKVLSELPKLKQQPESKTGQQALTDYVNKKHTQEECIGFIDGWQAAQNSVSPLVNTEELHKEYDLLVLDLQQRGLKSYSEYVWNFFLPHLQPKQSENNEAAKCPKCNEKFLAVDKNENYQCLKCNHKWIKDK